LRRRFFVDQFDGERAILRDDAAHHLGRVLRAAEGQLYELSDGRTVRLARIEKASRDEIEFSILETIPSRPPRLSVTLLLSIVKFDRFEWALEKATELGVSTIIPLAADRSEKSLVAGAPKRAERWRKILLESAQQSRRLGVPELLPLAPLEKYFASIPQSSNTGNTPQILLSERDQARSLRDVLAPFAAASASLTTLVIGPEGGWTDNEFRVSEAAGFLEASLGHTILRTETAVAAALAAINYALGD
jgi:16S rRNA (uracil1498-N3)-methyltransferase